MQIPFPFEHFNMYFRNTYNKDKLFSLIKLALDNYIININNNDKKYYQLHNNNTISGIYSASSKIVIYKYLL
jgi:predicted DNA-binding protein (MmcQ/YjbR family)